MPPRKPSTALVKRAALDYLLGASNISQANVGLQASNRAANARKELLDLLDTWVQEAAFSYFNAWLHKHKNELVAPVNPEPLVIPSSEHERVRSLAAEILSEPDAALQPFLQPRAVSTQILRKQHVSHRGKWAAYYRAYGCLVCKSKQKHYDRCGMCGTCYRRVWERLQAILRELEG
jgi:hypothetical protein